MYKLIHCTVSQAAKAGEIISKLQDQGLPAQSMSLLFSENEYSRSYLEQHTKAPEGAVTGGSAGMVLGSLAGWLAGIGSLAIPGLGPLIAAGPIMAALSGGAIGGAVGSLLGFFVGVGISEVEAKHDKSQLKEGHVLISVSVESKDHEDITREVFKEYGAENVKDAMNLAA